MTNKLGVYWSVMHRRPQDYAYFNRLNPSVFKIMDGGDNDYTWARDNLPDALIIARDHSLSEQHSDMLKDPAGTGYRHAQEWHKHATRLGFDRAKTLVLGINEPHIWEPGVPEALRRYTIALCDEASDLGLRVGAMQLSVGWPNNSGGESPPNWQPFDGVDDAIRHNNGALIAHEYWADNGPGENWGWWGGRVLKCPWQVPIVIGETGIDMYVKDGSVSKHDRGWQKHKSPEAYAAELADYTARMSADRRFAGCCVFATDFASQEWYSFDTERAHNAILATPIPQPPEPEPGPEPPIQPPPLGDAGVVHPIPGARITQHMYQRPEAYEQFGLIGHNGTDFGARLGTPALSCAAGIVAYTGDDPNYGLYVRVKLTGLHAYAFYAHLSELSVTAGQHVEAGQTVGLVGSTGNSTGPHLHFEIRLHNEDGTYREDCPMPKGRVDPQTWCAMHNLKL